MGFGLHLHPYSTIMAATALIALLLAVRAGMGTRKSITVSFTLFSAALFVWSLFKLLEWEIPSYEGRFESLTLQFVGICMIPASLFLFARALAFKPVRGVGIVLTLLPGAAFIVVVATNGFHHTFWLSDRFMIGYRHPPSGWAFWAFMAYTYAHIAASLTILARAVRRAKGVYARLLKLVLASFIPPLAANVFYIFVLRGFGDTDPTPAVFALTGIGLGFVLTQFDIFDIVPYAKSVILESIDTPMLVADAEGYLVGGNEEARRFFSFPDGFEGRLVSEMAPVLDLDMKDRESRSFSSGGVDYLVTCYIVRKGLSSWRGRLYLFRDIGALAKANRELAEANRELAEARTRAEAANASKSAFVATVSHELRNPLNAIIGLADLDLRDSLPDFVRADIETIRSSSRQLLGMVNDLLDISKMEAGKLELESVDFDLREQAMSVIKAFRPAVAMKGVILDVEIEDRAPRVVKGDPLRFGQVLMNLLGNAVKFTAKGSIIVRMDGLSPASGDDDPRSERVLVEVRDTGVGIPAEGLSSLFKDFSQADRSVARRFGGTGLGLAICKRLVDLMGGDVSVESTEGVGSSFSFSARFEPGDPEGVVSKACEIKGEGEPPARILRVLVADDDPVNATIARRYVERLGHETEVAGTGSEALSLLRSGGFDLAFLDLGFPDMDGLEIARAISSESGERTVHLVAMTANAGPEAVAQCRAAGMDEFLSKPLNPVDLGNLVARVCDAVPGPRPVPGADAPGSCPDGDSHLETGGRSAAMIDREALLEHLDGDEEFMRELLSIFVEEAPSREADISSAISAGDLESLRNVVHKLRGSGLTLRAGPLSGVAASIETGIQESTRQPGIRDIESYADDLRALLRRTADAAKELLDRGEE